MDAENDDAYDSERHDPEKDRKRALLILAKVLDAGSRDPERLSAAEKAAHLIKRSGLLGTPESPAIFIMGAAPTPESTMAITPEDADEIQTPPRASRRCARAFACCPRVVGRLAQLR
jgi:hypothetical protein